MVHILSKLKIKRVQGRLKFYHNVANMIVLTRDSLYILVAFEAPVSPPVSGTRVRNHDERSGQIVAPDVHRGKHSTEEYR